jgi:hypothetical protein
MWSVSHCCSKPICFLSSGLIKSAFTFILAYFAACLATVFLILTAALWTVAVNKAKSINGLSVESTPGSVAVSVGIVVSAGEGISMAWAAAALMTFSIIPYMITQVMLAPNVHPPPLTTNFFLGVVLL